MLPVNVTLFENRVTVDMIKLKLVIRSLIQYDSHPLKKKGLWTQTNTQIIPGDDTQGKRIKNKIF